MDSINAGGSKGSASALTATSKEFVPTRMSAPDGDGDDDVMAFGSIRNLLDVAVAVGSIRNLLDGDDVAVERTQDTSAPLLLHGDNLDDYCARISWVAFAIAEAVDRGKHSSSNPLDTISTNLSKIMKTISNRCSNYGQPYAMSTFDKLIHAFNKSFKQRQSEYTSTQTGPCWIPNATLDTFRFAYELVSVNCRIFANSLLITPPNVPYNEIFEDMIEHMHGAFPEDNSNWWYMKCLCIEANVTIYGKLLTSGMYHRALTVGMELLFDFMILTTTFEYIYMPITKVQIKMLLQCVMTIANSMIAISYHIAKFRGIEATDKQDNVAENCMKWALEAGLGILATCIASQGFRYITQQFRVEKFNPDNGELLPTKRLIPAKITGIGPADPVTEWDRILRTPGPSGESIETATHKRREAGELKTRLHNIEQKRLADLAKSAKSANPTPKRLIKLKQYRDTGRKKNTLSWRRSPRQQRK